MTLQRSGVVTSLVTPFTAQADAVGGTELDLHGIEALVRAQLRAGVGAIAVAGWIGEGPTLSRIERRTLLDVAREASRGRIEVLAHVGTSDTAKSIALAVDAEAAGADAVIVVTPPYSKPNANGFRSHILSIADNTKLPVYLEFDPDRTRTPVTARDMSSLMAIEGIIGVIDHSANALHVECLCAVGREEVFLTASEANSLASLAVGGHGIFSAVANVSPVCVVEMEAAWRNGDHDRARQIHQGLMPLIQLIEEEGVAALKHAMTSKFKMADAVRLPLVPLDEARTRQVDAAMEHTARMRMSIEDTRLLRFAR
jgi:4-hydroxy-tetrahydrodipicolinate synthase